MGIDISWPLFTEETAKQKVQSIEDDWNSKDPERVLKAYTYNSQWRNRTIFINGEQEIVKFLTRKWEKEIDSTLKNEYWTHTGNRIAISFVYEYKTIGALWFRSYGNENWEFDENGLILKRYASMNDIQISERDRRLNK